MAQPRTLSRPSLAAYGTLALLPLGLLAQSANPPPPPSFIPPPPPSFGPPNFGPPGMPPGQGTKAPQGSGAMARMAQSSDPRMQETVGLIRIPDMQTPEILEMLENFTGKPILRQQSLPQVKITFYSQGAMTRAEAITAIESLLALNGIAITEVGEKFLKAIPASIVNSQVAPRWEGTTLDAIPSQKIYEKIFELSFLNAQEAVALIQPLMSQGAPIAFDKSNLILINDALVNLQRIERLLQTVDQPNGNRNTTILTFQLQNLSSDEALRRLQQIQSGPLRRQLEGNTAFDADERTNQIIVFTHPGNQALLTDLIRKMDESTDPATNTKVFRIRYAEAKELVALIEQVVTGQKQSRESSGGPQSPAQMQAQQRQQQRQQQQNQTAASARSESSNLQFSSLLTMVADERANAIVAYGTPNDLTYLEKLIDEIDVLLAQVRIEVVIVDVRLENGETSGIDKLGLKYSATPTSTTTKDSAGKEVTTTTGGTDEYNGNGSIYGLNLSDITMGPDGIVSFSAVLDTVKKTSDATVLSAPTIMTTHNKEATVSVGEQRPVITGTTTDTSNISNRSSTVSYKDIKLELKVTPLIGSDGVIQMEVDQTIDSVIGEVTVDGNEQPVVGTRKATSYVSVKDGGMVVLGGLQKVDNNKSKGKYWIIGDIPLIGDLINPQSSSNVRSELLIFIRPTVVRTTEDANRDAQQQIDILEPRQKIREYLDRGTFRTPPPEKEEKKPTRKKR